MIEGYFTYELQIDSEFQLGLLLTKKKTDRAYNVFNCIIYTVVMAIEL